MIRFWAQRSSEEHRYVQISQENKQFRGYSNSNIVSLINVCKNCSGKAVAESVSKNKESFVCFMISAAQQESTYFPGAAWGGRGGGPFQ